jgi:hypothetical protein
MAAMTTADHSLRVLLPTLVPAAAKGRHNQLSSSAQRVIADYPAGLDTGRHIMWLGNVADGRAASILAKIPLAMVA